MTADWSTTQFSSMVNCRVTEYFRMEESFGGHLSQPSAPCKVSYKIRPGGLELYSVGYWKPPKIWLHKLSGHLFHCFSVVMVKKLFLITSLIAPYRYGKAALRSLWNLPSSRLSKPRSLSLSSQELQLPGHLDDHCWTCSCMLVSFLYVGGGGEGRGNSTQYHGCSLMRRGMLLLRVPSDTEFFYKFASSTKGESPCSMYIIKDHTTCMCIHAHYVQ